MSKQADRDRFLYQMAELGVPIGDARRILRAAATIQRCNEASCSYEWADKDRVACPGVKVAADCICDYDASRDGCPAHTCMKENPCIHSPHSTVQRVERTAKSRENLIVKILAPYGLEPSFQGDPRGWCVRILRPTDRRGESYSDGIGVPA